MTPDELRLKRLRAMECIAESLEKNIPPSDYYKQAIEYRENEVATYTEQIENNKRYIESAKKLIEADEARLLNDDLNKIERDMIEFNVKNGYRTIDKIEREDKNIKTSLDINKNFVESHRKKQADIDEITIDWGALMQQENNV